jgi:hypothetical protein
VKNQYVGDVGDYGKYALLRCFIDSGLRLGVNWYLTPDDGGSDGKKTKYDPKADTPLYHFLKDVALKNRDVRTIENSGLLANTEFYSKPLTSAIDRTQWHKNALAALKSADVVFLDPDNGLEVQKDDIQHTRYKEIVDYYSRGQSLIIYQHNGRYGAPGYKAICEKVACSCGISIENCMVLSGQSRKYIIVSQSNHVRAICAAVDKFLNDWKPMFSHYNIFEG